MLLRPSKTDYKTFQMKRAKTTNDPVFSHGDIDPNCVILNPMGRDDHMLIMNSDGNGSLRLIGLYSAGMAFHPVKLKCAVCSQSMTHTIRWNSCEAVTVSSRCRLNIRWIRGRREAVREVTQ